MKNKKYNYIYRITNTKENKHYIGVRSCDIDPYLDIGVKYKSTSKNIEFKQDQNKNPQDYIYQILEFFETRLEANEREVYLHKLYNVGNNINFYNECNQTSKFFDNTGNLEIANKISKANKGRIGVNNGEISKRVHKCDLDYYLNNGYYLGDIKYSEERLKNASKPSLGKIYVNNSYKETLIYPEEYIDYKTLGYILGRLPMSELQKFKLHLAHDGKTLTNEHKSTISSSTLGSKKSEQMKQKLSETRTGMIYINNGDIEKIINPFDQYEYIIDGWNLGKLPMPEKHKESISKSSIGKPGTTTGRTKINNGVVEKFVFNEELDSFIQQGWIKGSNPNRKQTDYSNRKGTTTGRIGINNGVNNKFIMEDELESYIQQGWYRGSKSNKK